MTNIHLSSLFSSLAPQVDFWPILETRGDFHCLCAQGWHEIVDLHAEGTFLWRIYLRSPSDGGVDVVLHHYIGEGVKVGENTGYASDVRQAAQPILGEFLGEFLDLGNFSFVDHDAKSGSVFGRRVRVWVIVENSKVFRYPKNLIGLCQHVLKAAEHLLRIAFWVDVKNSRLSDSCRG